MREGDWPDAQASCRRHWPCQTVWKSLWGNTITGSNPAHLPRPYLTASLRSGLQCPAESLPWRAAGACPLSAASSVPMSKPTDYFTCFIGCLAECRGSELAGRGASSHHRVARESSALCCSCRGSSPVDNRSLALFTPGQLLHLDYMVMFTSKLTARSRGDWGTWPPPSRLDFGRFCCTCSSLPDMSSWTCPFHVPAQHPSRHHPMPLASDDTFES